LWRPLHEAGGDPLYNNPCFWWEQVATITQTFGKANITIQIPTKKKFIATKKIITLDQLPDLQNYPME